MTTTPRGSPDMVTSQANKEELNNEQIRRTEGGAGRYPVADRVTGPPVSCDDGAQYLIIATATGAFTGKQNQIAQAVGTNASNGWYFRAFTAIDEGVLAYVQDEDVDYRWSGSAWTFGLSEASNAEIWAGSATDRFVSPRRLFTAMESVALTDGATITPDFSGGINFHVTLGGNRTLANPTNQKAGQSGRIRVTQDGTGSRTLAFGSAWLFPGGDPVMSTTAGATDVIAYYVHASGSIEAGIMKALA